MKLKCNKQICGHTWFSRTDKKPLVCPKCKSYDWDSKGELNGAVQAPDASSEVKE